MTPTVAILIPVLGRPHRVGPTIESVTAATPESHRLLFVASEDDPVELAALEQAGADYLVIPADRGSWAKKINDGYRATTEEWIFTGADDLAFRLGWFSRALAWADEKTGVIGTNDIANPRVMQGQHSTHSLFRRSYVDEHGTIDGIGIVHEAYAHQFADDEAIQTAMARGVYVHAFDSIVEHLHPMVGKAPDDDTYRLGRADTPKSKRLFLSRRRLWMNPMLIKSGSRAPARAVVFTASYGGTDTTLHPQIDQDMPVDWVCFTDQPDLRAPAPWTVVYSPARFGHPCLAAKVHKATPTIDCPDVVWIDASMEVTSRSFVREALAARHDGVAVFTHPRRDCAPGDQLVRTVNRGEVRIDELVPGLDRLISWQPPKKGTPAGSHLVDGDGNSHRGYAFDRAMRLFSGDLVVMTTDGTRTRVTPNHWVSARWRIDAREAFAVYLMRRGNWWRVGKSYLLSNGFGPSQRARCEGADAVWLLGVYHTEAEALIAEQKISAGYGVTQAVFRVGTGPRRGLVTDVMLKELHEHLALKGSGERARRLLVDFGLELEHPVWPSPRMGPRRPFRLRAVNLVDGWMDIPVVDGECDAPRWDRVIIMREPVIDLPVYSLDVERHHTYVGDGQLLYNCIYLEAEASLGAEGQGGKYADQPLREQVAHYRAEGHPEHGGLYACGTVAWDLANPKAVELGRAWLAECEQWSWQDQLSFPVVCRRLGITPGVFPVRQIERSGRGFLANRYLRIHDHTYLVRTTYQAITAPPTTPIDVSVLIPYASTDEARVRAHTYVIDWYTRHHPAWEIVEGTCAGEWSKGEALADAAARASHDVFVLADADSIVPADTLNDAATRVAAGTPWVVPHRKVYRLSEAHTARVYAGADPAPRDLCRPAYSGVVGGGITVLSRATWNVVGGIDPRFLQWGGEDLSFGWALETLAAPCVRLGAPLYHLWHQQEFQGQRRRGSPESESLAGRYRSARNQPDAMRALVEEHAAELVVM